MKSSSKGCYKKGGAVKKKDTEEVEKEIEGEAEHKKHGGKVHKAHGHKAKERGDKKPRLATGGKVSTPKSPLTGAMPSGLPGGGKGFKMDKEND